MESGECRNHLREVVSDQPVCWKTQINYFFLLRSERESNVRLRGEGGIVKKKLQSVMKDTEEYKTNIAKMTTENQKLHSTIKNMEKDISDLKNEIKIR